MKVDIRIVFKDPKPKPDPCPIGFHLSNNQCIPLGHCPDGYERLGTNECHKIEDIKTCPDGSKTLRDQECPPKEPEICTPDGGVCPPCTEGEEGSHCMDDDEQQDGDDGLPEYVPPSDETEYENGDQEEEPEANSGGDEDESGNEEGGSEGDSEQPEPQFG